MRRTRPGAGRHDQAQVGTTSPHHVLPSCHGLVQWRDGVEFNATIVSGLETLHDRGQVVGKGIVLVVGEVVRASRCA